MNLRRRREDRETYHPYYQTQLQKEEEMMPFVIWCWVILIAVIVLGFVWEAVRPLLQYLGIHS